MNHVICYRCQQPILEATRVESFRGFRHPTFCVAADLRPVEKPLAPPKEAKPKIVYKTVKSAPELIPVLDRRKTAVVAGCAAVLGGALGAALATFL